MLVRDFPGYYIPPMAKKTGKPSFEKWFISQRMITLQQFIDSICEHKELRSSLQFITFLKSKNRKQFDSIKKEFEKKVYKISDMRNKFNKRMFDGKKGIDLQDFNNVEGEVESVISTELKDYAINVDELIKQLVPLYDKLENNSKQLLLDIEQVSDSVEKIRSNLSEAHKIHKKFNQRVKFAKVPETETLYENLNNAMAVWKASFKKHSLMVQNRLVNTFKYTSKELLAHFEVKENFF